MARCKYKLSCDYRKPFSSVYDAENSAKQLIEKGSRQYIQVIEVRDGAERVVSAFQAATKAVRVPI